MISNWKAALGAAILSLSTFGAGAVWTASAQARPLPPLVRGDERGDRNLRADRQRIEAVIDQLQRDPRDYGGHREQAVDLLMQARAQIDAGLAYEEHSGR
jgi:hypothetical protein